MKHLRIQSTLPLVVAAIGAFLIICSCSHSLPAQTLPQPPPGPSANIYQPGLIDRTYPLSIFLPPAMKPACDALAAKNLAEAEKPFAAEISRDPGSMAAYVGYLQSCPSRWDILFPVYQQDELTNPSPINSFKLGVLSSYMLSQRWNIHPGKGDEVEFGAGNRLSVIAADNLQSAYTQTNSAIAGFALEESSTILYKELKPGVLDQFYPSMLLNVGGEKAFDAYMYAKKQKWNAPPPPIPSISKSQLAVLRFIVGGLYAENSYQEGGISSDWVDGKSVVTDDTVPLTSDQKKAMVYLSTWINHIKAASK